jgi:hypothetical protein
MKSLDSATPMKRRKFFSSLTAIGAMLGGIVPELRAQTAVTRNVQPTPGTLTPIPPLSATATATMYAQAKVDANARKLLSDAGPNLVTGAPVYSYDMGNQGRHIAIPIRNSSTGELSAYIFYGTFKAIGSNGTTVNLTAAVSLTSGGDLRYVDQSGKAVSAPPETRDIANAFYPAFLPQQYLATRVQPTYGTTPRENYCFDKWQICHSSARIALLTAAGWGISCLFCILGVLILPGIPGSQPVIPWIIRQCKFQCTGGAIEKLRTWGQTFDACYEEWQWCMGFKEPPPVPFTSAPDVPKGMPTPPMASPPGVPSGMPTSPFTPYGSGGKF